MAKGIIALVVFVCAGVASASPAIHVKADGISEHSVRDAFVRADVSKDPQRSLDVAVESAVQSSARHAEVTVRAKVVVSDGRGIQSVVSASAKARGRSRASSSIARLQQQALEEAVTTIAERVRKTPCRATPAPPRLNRSIARR